MDCYCLVDIASKIAPIGSGVVSLRNCSRVDCVLFETLINRLLVSVFTPIANEITLSGSGVDSSWDCSVWIVSLCDI